jgi:hypothetical protein
MFKILLTLTFSCALFLVNAQEVHQKGVFNILEIGSKYSSELLINSLTNADWCGMVNPKESYIMVFDDGSKVKVGHYNQLKSDQIYIDENCVRETDVIDNAQYSISPEGYVIRFLSKKPTKSSNKQK